MIKNGFIVSFGELFLKSRGVRRILIKKLVWSLGTALKKAEIKSKISILHDRIFIETEEFEKTAEILGRIFGIAWFSKAFFLSHDSCEVALRNDGGLPELVKFVEENYQNWIKKSETFALNVKKGSEIKEKKSEIIEILAKNIDRKVNLNNPQKEICVEGKGKGWFVYFDKQKGAGGFPIGSQGKILSLVSGGIDSPVSSYLIAKRGAENVWVHFHSFPIVSRRSIDKVKQTAEVFLRYQPNLKIYFVPFSAIQMEIKKQIPPNHRVLLYRRLMLKIAQKIAQKEKCLAMVTGESLGQVSSQTLQNLTITDSTLSGTAKTLILRPLIGMDKEEIIAIAKKIGTFDISIQAQEDCCTLFVPKNQSASAKLEVIKDLEKKLAITKLVSQALKETKMEVFQ